MRQPYNNCHCRTKLQTAKRTLSTSKHLIKFTCSDFPCHLKVNRDNLHWLHCNHLWNGKKGERLTITSNPFTKIYKLRRIPPAVAVWMWIFHLLQEPMRLQDLLNSTHTRAEKRQNTFLESTKNCTYKFSAKIRCCLFITSSCSYIPFPQVLTFLHPTSSSPRFPVPPHPWVPKSHIPVPLLVTAFKHYYY